MNGSWGCNRFQAIIVEHEDSVFAPKKNATLRILCYCKYLARPLTIVVSGESSKKRMPKLSFAGKDDAGAADKNNERKEIDHLKKQSIQLVTRRSSSGDGAPSVAPRAIGLRIFRKRRPSSELMVIN
jgi:hypothetical protein